MVVEFPIGVDKLLLLMQRGGLEAYRHMIGVARTQLQPGWIVVRAVTVAKG